MTLAAGVPLEWKVSEWGAKVLASYLRTCALYGQKPDPRTVVFLECRAKGMRWEDAERQAEFLDAPPVVSST